MKPVRCAAAVLCLLAARAALADATVVTKTTLAGMPRRPGAASAAPKERDLTTTTYYKKGMVRTEIGDTVTILVGERIYLIDTARKTYQVAPRKEIEDQSNNPMMAMLQVQSDAQLKPGGKTATILGKPAKNYLITMSMRLNLPKGMPPMNGGDAPRTPPKMPVIAMKMEVWATEAVSIGKANALAPGGVAFMKPLLAKLQSIPGLALRTTMTQTVEGMMLPGMGKDGTTVRSEVVSLDEKPLPDSLFAPPKGFKQRPYSGPSFPGMPGGGPG